MSRLTDNLISFWALDEASGNAVDSYGANTLTETSGTIASAGGGRDFEADDSEWFEVNSNASLATGDIDFTVAAWVNAESLDGTIRDAASKFSSGASGEWILGWNGVSRYRFSVRNAADSATTTQTFTSLGLPTVSTNYLLIGWHDSVNNLLCVQANGGAVDSQAYSGGVLSGSSKFILGNRDGATSYWDGIIRRVMFWKRVLTANERTFLYNGGLGRTLQELRIRRSMLGLPTLRQRLW